MPGDSPSPADRPPLAAGPLRDAEADGVSIHVVLLRKIEGPTAARTAGGTAR
jgi:hypothetical protein